MVQEKTIISESPTQFFLTCDYEESLQDTYKGLVLTNRDLDTGESTEERFYTGDASVDYIDVMKRVSQFPNILALSLSSSMDHFVSDGVKYKWGVVHGEFEQILPVEVNDYDQMLSHYKEVKSQNPD